VSARVRGQTSRLLRKAIKLGGSNAITIPASWLEAEWVWIAKEDSKIIIEPARVE